MIKHYLKIALRNLFKHKGYTLINLTGLALGIVSGILIMIYVFDELSYDNFHLNRDRLYRVTTIFTKDGKQGGGMDTNAWPVGDILRQQFPEVEAVVYMRSANLMADLNGKKVKEQVFYASPEFFSMFTFPLIKGGQAGQLSQPFTVVISKQIEEKYFGGTDAVGKIITFNDTLHFHVTGVMENIPENSHIQMDMVASFTSFEKLRPDFNYQDGWGNINMRNYLMLRNGADIEAFRAKAENLYTEKAGEMLKQWGMDAKVGFEPFNDIYLRTAVNGMGPLGSAKTVYALIGVGLFVIMLACINFINLSTARSMLRAKEVGVKKSVGSSRSRLIGQFLTESLFVTILAFVLALLVIGLFLPVFNSLLGKTYTLVSLLELKIIAASFLLLLLIVIASGYYPAWVVSAYRPAEILKGKIQSSLQGAQFRRVLVVFQFAISVSLVSGTFIVLNQIQFMQSKDLGFTDEEIFVVNVRQTNPVDGNAYEAFMNELKSQTLVKQVSYCNALPAVSGWRGQIAYPEGKTGDDAVDTQYIAADDNYINTIGLTLIAGRNFDANRKTDIDDALIINETAVKAFGWETPEKAIGKRITSPSGTPAGIVIGVVKDYHDIGLQNKIAPNAIDYNANAAYLYAVRFTSTNTHSLIEIVGDIWKKYFPENEFNYFFLSDAFAKQYEQEQRLARIFTVFSATTILIAVIGLFGLVSFLITSRTKEIGIRKILGASVGGLTAMLTREFVVLVVLANVISIPIVIHFSQQWLQGFAFQMDLNPLIFILTGTLTLTLMFITVGIQTIKAARANPVKSLRYE